MQTQGIPDTLDRRDAAELARSRQEAEKTPLAPSQVERYLSPPGDSPYPLEYMFYLVGDVAGKDVLDLGCGIGEELVPLIYKGARVIGIDLSPELIDLAERRVAMQCAGFPTPQLFARSAYETGLADRSLDMVFCSALLHHLDLPTVLKEISRILRPGGRFIVREPVRFSRTLTKLRKLFPEHKDVSEYEHPLTREEYATIARFFELREERAFRLPILPLGVAILPPPA